MLRDRIQGKPEDHVDRFENKVVAIAGGAGGIGSGVSLRLAAEGAAVMVGDINFEDASRVAAEIQARGGRATPFMLNIGDEASVIEFIETCVRLYGGLDGFHANALDASRREDDDDLITMDLATYDQMMGVNARGYVLCTRYAVPQLLKRGGGAMLYTSSGAAYAGDGTRPVYAMSKSAVHALSRYVASRWGKQGVRSNVIAPGLIVHAGVRAVLDEAALEKTLAGVKTPRLGEPEDIAAMAALLLSDDGAFVTGQVISVDGGGTMRA
jgi:NAD(P)-dependent dehydrogenase (short-subunit alcohol dehydrogenase family)